MVLSWLGWLSEILASRPSPYLGTDRVRTSRRRRADQVVIAAGAENQVAVRNPSSKTWWMDSARPAWTSPTSLLRMTDIAPDGAN